MQQPGFNNMLAALQLHVMFSIGPFCEKKKKKITTSMGVIQARVGKTDNG